MRWYDGLRLGVDNDAWFLCCSWVGSKDKGAEKLCFLDAGRNRLWFSLGFRGRVCGHERIACEWLTRGTSLVFVSQSLEALVGSTQGIYYSGSMVTYTGRSITVFTYV